MFNVKKKNVKNGRFSPNARLNSHARFKTGDLATLIKNQIRSGKEE